MFMKNPAAVKRATQLTLSKTTKRIITVAETVINQQSVQGARRDEAALNIKALCPEDSLMTKGSCLCGSIRFEVEAFGSDIYKCHCSKCRKGFGGASSAVALAPEEKFSWLQGKGA